jgi:hypothetical protein
MVLKRPTHVVAIILILTALSLWGCSFSRDDDTLLLLSQAQTQEPGPTALRLFLRQFRNDGAGPGIPGLRIVRYRNLYTDPMELIETDQDGAVALEGPGPYYLAVEAPHGRTFLMVPFLSGGTYYLTHPDNPGAADLTPINLDLGALYDEAQLYSGTGSGADLFERNQPVPGTVVARGESHGRAGRSPGRLQLDPAAGPASLGTGYGGSGNDYHRHSRNGQHRAATGRPRLDYPSRGHQRAGDCVFLAMCFRMVQLFLYGPFWPDRLHFRVRGQRRQ